MPTANSEAGISNEDKTSGSVGQDSTVIDTKTSTVKITNSPYLPADKPSEEYLRKVAIRTIEQIDEDLLEFSLVQNPKNPAVDNNFNKTHWEGFMGSIKIPTTSMKVTQLVSPRVLATKAESEKFVDKSKPNLLYDGAGGVDNMGHDNLLALARAVYGDKFNPLTASGRQSGFLYDKESVNQIHVGF